MSRPVTYEFVNPRNLIAAWARLAKDAGLYLSATLKRGATGASMDDYSYRFLSPNRGEKPLLTNLSFKEAQGYIIEKRAQKNLETKPPYSPTLDPAEQGETPLSPEELLRGWPLREGAPPRADSRVRRLRVGRENQGHPDRLLWQDVLLGRLGDLARVLQRTAARDASRVPDQVRSEVLDLAVYMRELVNALLKNQFISPGEVVAREKDLFTLAGSFEGLVEVFKEEDDAA